MTYVCSDIHGEYELFLFLLKYINFSQDDEMIILGDIIDKGFGSVRMLELVSNYKNFSFLIGNHEHDFLKYVKALRSDLGNDEKVIKELRDYFLGDGKMLTLKHIDWLESRPYYIEREKYICVHSGIPILDNNTLVSLDKVTANQFVYDRRFKEPSVLPNTNKCILFGHTPVNYLTDKYEIIAYQKKENPKDISDYVKIHLDIGSWLGGGVGCLCIETLKCHYVKPNKEMYSKDLMNYTI